MLTSTKTMDNTSHRPSLVQSVEKRVCQLARCVFFCLKLFYVLMMKLEDILNWKLFRCMVGNNIFTGSILGTLSGSISINTQRPGTICLHPVTDLQDLKETFTSSCPFYLPKRHMCFLIRHAVGGTTCQVTVTVPQGECVSSTDRGQTMKTKDAVEWRAK